MYRLRGFCAAVFVPPVFETYFQTGLEIRRNVMLNSDRFLRCLFEALLLLLGVLLDWWRFFRGPFGLLWRL
jgi:hypothetical protein